MFTLLCYSKFFPILKEVCLFLSLNILFFLFTCLNFAPLRFSKIRKIIRILLITAVSFIALLLLLYLLLLTPPFQQKVKDIVLSGIMEKTHNNMSIGKLSFKPFNRIELEDVYVEDLKGDTLLFAEKFSASCSLLKLLKNRLLIRSVGLDDFVIKINRDNPEGDFNFKFFVDAFQSDSQETASSEMEIRINDIVLKKGRLQYDVLSEPAAGTGYFDVNHICISNLQTNIDLNSIDLENLNIAVEKLSFFEQSGLNICQLKTKLISKEKKISLKNFLLQLPDSELTVPDAWIDYKGYAQNELIDKGSYSLSFGNNRISPKDVKMFYPTIEQLKEPLTFTGVFAGTFPKINILQLTIDYGTQLHLNIGASIDDYKNWQYSPVRLDIESSSINASGIRQAMKLISDETENRLAKLETISISGNLYGSLPDIHLQLDMKTDKGSLQLNGLGGYNPRFKTAQFDAEINAEKFNLGALVQDTILGCTDLKLKTQGDIDSLGRANAYVSATVDNIDFNGYPCQQIQIDASYKNDSIKLAIDSKDANIPLSIKGLAIPQKQTARLFAKMNNICLDSLHLLSNYKNAYLSAIIKADMKGWDIEKMKLNLAIDSLSFSTDKGYFKEQKFRFDYHAADNEQKQLTVSSHTLNITADGNFSFSDVERSIAESFPAFFPKIKTKSGNKTTLDEAINFKISLKNAHLLSDLLELPKEIPDSALVYGRYAYDGENFRISASAYTQFHESDTLQLSITLLNREKNLEVIFNIDNKSNSYNFDGTIDANIEFIPQPEKSFPNMNITMNPAVFVLNEMYFDFLPAKIEIQDRRYVFHDLLLEDKTSGYIKINGIVSDNPNDSLCVNISKIQLETVFDAVKTNIPLYGTANGEIVAKRLLSKPLILSRGFEIDSIVFADNELGDLDVTSIWSSERKGMALRATLKRGEQTPSTVSGFILPEKDSLSLTANIHNIDLKWLKEPTKDILFGLDGTLNANLKYAGRMGNPVLTGVAYFDSAKAGVTMLNTIYHINDSIYFKPEEIELKRFTVKDENSGTFQATGKISHKQFGEFIPNLSMSLSNFLVANNEQHTDSLFYGKLRINGLLNLKQNGKRWMLAGNINHSNDSKLMVNIPSPSTTAERHNIVNFVNKPTAANIPYLKNRDKNVETVTVPVKINVAIWLDPTLTVGAIFNPQTGDAALVRGNGLINFLYDMNDSSISLGGDYVIESGKATLSLANISRKTFTVQENSKLTFLGNPMATAFDITAIYSLRADLTTLDPGFQLTGITSRKIPVNCSLSATGNIEKMGLKYNILLPNEPGEIQQKVNDLLYTDDLKIKEIAYLLAFGAFMPVNTDNTQPSNSSIWSSLASSSITSQLNSLLSSVLNENWSIGTSLRAGSNINDWTEVDVNISTRLFDNRLTLNSSLGYNSDPLSSSNITGDIDVEYKLIPSGNVLLRVYNVTNNQYYEKAKTTQGVGITYKREAKSFKQLFDKFRKK